MNSTTADELRGASLGLAIRLVGLILVVFLVIVGVTYAIVTLSQSQATTSELVKASTVESPEDAPPDILVAIRSTSGLAVSGNAPKWFPKTAALTEVARTGVQQQRTLAVNGDTYLVLTTAVRGRVVQTATDTREGVEEIQRLAFGLVIAGLIGGIASAVIAAVIARRAMRPMFDALALQRRFVADASHELRTPLTLITTRAQLLRRGLNEPGRGGADVVTALDEILRDSRDLTAILEDLLIVADPRGTVDLVPLDLGELARDAVSSMAPEATSRNIELVTSVQETPIFVNGARISLQRLCAALIANAVDHARTLVTVVVRQSGRTVEIRVRDDGAGFPAGFEERAFERFASARLQSDDGEGDGRRHYGIGLALVADVAARHGGSVRVEPRTAGTGAEIVVRLPHGNS